MNRINADYLLAIAEGIVRAREDCARFPGAIRSNEIRQADAATLKDNKGKLDFLGLKMTELQFRRLIKRLEDGTELPNQEMLRLLSELHSRLQDECHLRHFLVLTDREREFYENSCPFGEPVQDKLPSIIMDAEEAGKCFALGRYTASVFHLMRIMEVGCQEFGTKLDISLTNEKVWQVILDQINKKIGAMSQKDKMTKIYSSITSHLYNVKVAWRNEVMHPKATYTPDEAESVIVPVRIFMGDLVGVL